MLLWDAAQERLDREAEVDSLRMEVAMRDAVAAVWVKGYAEKRARRLSRRYGTDGRTDEPVDMEREMARMARFTARSRKQGGAGVHIVSRKDH